MLFFAQLFLTFSNLKSPFKTKGLSRLAYTFVCHQDCLESKKNDLAKLAVETLASSLPNPYTSP